MRLSTIDLILYSQRSPFGHSGVVLEITTSPNSLRTFIVCTAPCHTLGEAEMFFLFLLVLYL